MTWSQRSRSRSRCTLVRRERGPTEEWQAGWVDDPQSEEVLLRGNEDSGEKVPNAHLRDGIVLKEAGPWSASVHAFLCHLEREGFAGSPRMLGTGFEDDGRETLSYLPGESPHPYAWSNEAVGTVGRLLRDLHRAAASFRPPIDAQWQPIFTRDLRGSHPTFGHCDAGPWNIIALAGQPYALVDWEFAGPVDAIWELAEVTWLNAQLHDDVVAERCGLPDAHTRAQQARLILDGYGLASGERSGFVDKMVELAVHSILIDDATERAARESEHG